MYAWMMLPAASRTTYAWRLLPLAVVKMRCTLVTPSAAPGRTLCHAFVPARCAQQFWASRLQYTWLIIVHISHDLLDWSVVPARSQQVRLVHVGAVHEHRDGLALRHRLGK